MLSDNGCGLFVAGVVGGHGEIVGEAGAGNEGLGIGAGSRGRGDQLTSGRACS